MDRTGVLKFCKELGCCDACCLRYLGLRNPAAYDKPTEFVKKLLESDENAPNVEVPSTNNIRNDIDKNTNVGEDVSGGDEVEHQSTPAKRCKPSVEVEVCVSCVGLLQEHMWPDMIEMAYTQVQEKGYSCESFACGLSSPLAIIIRERLITLNIKERFPQYNICATGVKEAWKWSFCDRVSRRLGLRPESGATAPLLLTFNMEYTHDDDEISELRTLYMAESGDKRVGRATSRRVVDEMTSRVRRATRPRRPATNVKCRDVHTEHAPIYLGGRYIKLSRSLPQSPWILHGVRMMPTSVQEIIFQPIAKLYGICESEMDSRMKMISAGREDVDVRCLGDGRPFAVEILDPRLSASAQQLQQLCDEISRSDDVKVRVLTHVTKEQLCELKKGEESKTKTYEALCIKLKHTDEDISEDASVRVTGGDMSRVCDVPRVVCQRTPLRVLHRRPLHTRPRTLLQVQAYAVPDHPRLFVVRVQTEAGTYVKEWAHGELGRSSPALADALPADILALDVTNVNLHWPPATTSTTSATI